MSPQSGERTIGFLGATSGYSEVEKRRRERLYAVSLPPMCRAVVDAVPGSPEFFDRRDDFSSATTAARAHFLGGPSRRYDVIVWAGAIDPALSQIRELSSVPVIGPGESSMYLASTFGRAFSIVTVDEHAVAMTQLFLEGLVAKPPIVSVRSIEQPVRSIMSDPAVGIAALRREIRQAVAVDGAEGIYLGAMTLGTLGVGDDISAEVGVPVINPVHVSASVAAQIALSLPAPKDHGELPPTSLTENR